MKRILIIAALTWKSAFRYRLFWILAVLLAAAVAGLPMLLKDDGTAKGLTQILLTYTMTAVASLLGFATLWLSCGTLAKDVEECQMQVVAVKPIGRWQIWLGKWVGILALDALLLALSGVAIFFSLQWRARHLPPDEQRVLQNEIFVARASMKERLPDFTPEIERRLDLKIRQTHPPESAIPELRKQITEEVRAVKTDVPPGQQQFWVIDMHTLPQETRDRGFQVRIKFHTSNVNPDATYQTYWRFGSPNSTRAWVTEQTFPGDSFQTISVPPHLLDDKGRLIVQLYNANDVALVFSLEDGFEVLYFENTFPVNFARGMTVIFCWLALLSAIGLASASFLSFPVAAFVSLALLILGFSTGTLQTVVDEGTITGFDSATSHYGHSPVDYIIVPTFHGALNIIKMVESFSPIDSLSSGRSITWPVLGQAIAQIVLLLGGFFCVVGIFLFSRRELATGQSNV